MPLGLGIDTGGTYTDAVVVDFDRGEIVAKAKALTTKQNLVIGIANSIERLKGIDPSQIKLVSISTTLATNSIVEGQGAKICLLLIGYDSDEYILKMYNLHKENVRIIKGKHNLHGEEIVPLDLEGAKRAILEMRDKVKAYAISSYWSEKNPEHERRVESLVKELTNLPTVCSVDLTNEVNAYQRAATTALNARLIPIIKNLIVAVMEVLKKKGISAPLMVVKGDGHLMSAEVALEKPIETILSGPAASIVGARGLTEVDEAIVVDMGGTTTDIAILNGGKPGVNPQGAKVGDWLTCVQAADIRTSGLGGDSYLFFDRSGRLKIGPRRVIPLSLAALEFPQIVDELKVIDARNEVSFLVQFTDFLMLIREPEEMDSYERALVEILKEGPSSIFQLSRRLKLICPYLLRSERLEAGDYIGRLGLTPTDILHVDGTYQEWNKEAALLGAKVFSKGLRVEIPTLVKLVKEEVTRRMSLEILNKLISDRLGEITIPDSRLSSHLIESALGNINNGEYKLNLEIKKPILAIGAPVEAYLPSVAERLGTELLIPRHAEVANAFGAITGSIIESVEILIEPNDHRGYTLHFPLKKLDFKKLEEAVDYAWKAGTELVRSKAKKAGAAEMEIKINREDRYGTVAEGFGDSIYLETKLKITAIGRPQW